jgi:hypothetical protein
VARITAPLNAHAAPTQFCANQSRRTTERKIIVSSNYAGTAVYPATIPILDDADPRNTTALLAAAFEALTDRATWLKSFLQPLLDNHVFTELGGTKTMTANIVVTTGTAKTWTFSLPTFYSSTADFTATGIAIGAAGLSGVMTLSGAGHFRLRKVYFSGTTSVGIADGDLFVAHNLVGSPNLTLSDTNAAAGDIIEVANKDSTFDAIIKDSAGATLATVSQVVGTGRVPSARFAFDLFGSGKWELLS